MARKKKGKKGSYGCKAKVKARVQQRCMHREALQFTGTQARWCPNCGACQFKGEGDPFPRWRKPKLSDRRVGNSGRKPNAVKAKGKVSSGKVSTAKAARKATAPTKRVRVRKGATEPFTIPATDVVVYTTPPAPAHVTVQQQN